MTVILHSHRHQQCAFKRPLPKRAATDSLLMVRQKFRFSSDVQEASFFSTQKYQPFLKGFMKNKLLISICAQPILCHQVFRMSEQGFKRKSLEQDPEDLHRFNISRQASSNCEYMHQFQVTTFSVNACSRIRVQRIRMPGV